MTAFRRYGFPALFGALFLLGLSAPRLAQASDDAKYSPAMRGGEATCHAKYGATASLGPAFRAGVTKDCFSCPVGFRDARLTRTRGPKACVKNESYEVCRGKKKRRRCRTKTRKHFSHAHYRGKMGCPNGQFRNGTSSKCYACPPGFKRSLIPGKDLTKLRRACVAVRGGPKTK